MKNYPGTIEAMMKLTDVPVVSINQEGTFTFLNTAFTREYGWTSEDLLNESVVKIMPKYMRSAHSVGFSRFLTTESSVLLGKPLPLKIMCKDGKELAAIHFIIGEKKDGHWSFSAIIDNAEKSGQ